MRGTGTETKRRQRKGKVGEDITELAKDKEGGLNEEEDYFFMLLHCWRMEPTWRDLEWTWGCTLGM